MPRYPDIDPLSKRDLKTIARMRDTDGYLLNGWYPTFDAYCLGEWQRSANTINRRLKREGFGSKRTKKIAKRREQVEAQTADWIRSKYRAMKSGNDQAESVSPSVSPNISSVSPSPSNNSSKSSRKNRETMSSDKLTDINTGTMRTQKANLTEHNQDPSISSGVAKKTQEQLDAEWEQAWNS